MCVWRGGGGGGMGGGGGEGLIHMKDGYHIGILEPVFQILNIRKIGNNMVNAVHIPDLNIKTKRI